MFGSENPQKYHKELKFMFSKKATKIDKIFTVDLTVTTYYQSDGEDFVNFCGLLRKRELYYVQRLDTVPIDEILSVKNPWAWVSMVSYLKK